MSGENSPVYHSSELATASVRHMGETLGRHQGYGVEKLPKRGKAKLGNVISKSVSRLPKRQVSVYNTQEACRETAYHTTYSGHSKVHTVTVDLRYCM